MFIVTVLIGFYDVAYSLFAACCCYKCLARNVGIRLTVNSLNLISRLAILTIVFLQYFSIYENLRKANFDMLKYALDHSCSDGVLANAILRVYQDFETLKLRTEAALVTILTIAFFSFIFSFCACGFCQVCRNTKRKVIDEEPVKRSNTVDTMRD